MTEEPTKPKSELELLQDAYANLAFRLGEFTYQCDAIKQEMRALNLRADQIKRAAADGQTTAS